MHLSGVTDTTPDISMLMPSADLLSRSREEVHTAGRLGAIKTITATKSFSEVLREYNKGISLHEIEAWVLWKWMGHWPTEDQKQAFKKSEWGRYIRSEGTDRYVQDGHLFYCAGELLPLPIYTYGNIYDRILQLEKDKAHIANQWGGEVFDRQQQIIEATKPRMLSVLNPDPNERPIIKVISDVATNAGIFSIAGVRDEYMDVEEAVELRVKNGAVIQKPRARYGNHKTINLDGDSRYTLQYVFSKWLFTLNQDKDFHKSSAAYVAQFYIENLSFRSEEHTAAEKAEIKMNARLEGEALFARFLHEVLTFDDQQKLDLVWNRIYNGWGELNYERVPIGFTCSSTFKNKRYEITPIQRQGIAFMEAMGSGINAFDVGVGKTMTAIATLAHMITCGKALRPLVVVPKPTYRKWLAEIGGYIDKKTGEAVTGMLSGTGIGINAWYNLGTDTDAVTDKRIPANTITIVTYEGFKKIGISEGISGDLKASLARILVQAKEGESQRDKELELQKLEKMIGTANEGTTCDVDKLGFDYVIIDEAHNFKNVFDKVQADEDEGSRYSMTGGQSARGVKAFLILNYLQRKYGACSMLLTATPFTNSPLEIYSMLSLVAYPNMVKQAIENIRTFFDLFVMPTMEYVVTAKDQIEMREVIKGFTNRILLQKLINGHIMYRTGEEAGVTRPTKVNLPLIYEIEDKDGDGVRARLPQKEQILTYLTMTERQIENQQAIVGYARDANPKTDPGAMLKALNMSLDNALSPFIYEKGNEPASAEEFINESPKLRYVVDCIKTVKSWHEARGEGASGQVIYANRGKDYFYLIKLYLEEFAGFKKAVAFEGSKVDEVEIIESSISEDKKERIKQAFLEGACKVIIGTATIREGIDLQKNGTVIYNVYPEWNPTDIRQLEGRIWRQGNRYKYVRIAMPLVQDSMDVFVFQKLEEKTARINDVWSKADRGNVLDVESLDPNEVKMALISDLNKLVKMVFDEEVQEARKEVRRAENSLEVLETAKAEMNRYNARKAHLVEQIKRASEQFAQSSYLINVPEKAPGLGRVYHDADEYKDARKIYDKAVELRDALAGYNSLDDKGLLALARKAISTNNAYFSFAPISYINWAKDQFTETLAVVSKMEATLLRPKGYNLQSDLAPIVDDYKKELAQRVMVQDAYKGESNSDRWKKLGIEIAERKAALAIEGQPPEVRAQQFDRMNELMLSQRRSEAAGRDIIVKSVKADEAPANSKDIRIRRARAAKALMDMLELELEFS
jgi:SNF2 family DNA or RNA helicase